jgi:hypothetical protein
MVVVSNWSSYPQFVAFEQAIIDNPDDDTPPGPTVLAWSRYSASAWGVAP